MCKDQRVQNAHRAKEGSARAYAKQYNNERLHQLLSYETPLKLVSLRADGDLMPRIEGGGHSFGFDFSVQSAEPLY